MDWGRQVSPGKFVISSKFPQKKKIVISSLRREQSSPRQLGNW
jgi:hypothetical protein